MSVRNLRGVLGVALLLGTGCGDSPVSVRGTVTLDGKPVEGATILFLPEGGNGRQAVGLTDAEGNFRLTTISANDGAFRGKYKVAVQYNEGAEAPPGGNVKDVMQGFEKAQKTKRPSPKYVIPARYSDPEKTELRQEVPTNGPVKLELVSK